MFRMLVNIGGIFDLYVSSTASRELRECALPSVAVVGDWGPAFVERLRMDTLADHGRPRYLLLLTESFVPDYLRRHIVAELEDAVGEELDRLIIAQGQSEVRDIERRVFDACEKIDASVDRYRDIVERERLEEMRRRRGPFRFTNEGIGPFSWLIGAWPLVLAMCGVLVGMQVVTYVSIRGQWSGLNKRVAALEAMVSGLDLRGADLRGADLRGADLRGADLRGMALEGADLGQRDLRRSDLSEANLTYANLIEADLSEAILIATILEGANLTFANLWSADLRYARLDGAKLAQAYLAEADLRGTSLRAADLTDANLSAVKNLTQEQLDSACGSSSPLAVPEELKWRSQTCGAR